MSASVLLQPWTTVVGALTTTTVTQPANGYADLAFYSDVVAYLEVSDIAAGPLFQYETSPTLDDSMFDRMDLTSFVPSLGVTPRVYRLASPKRTPLARYMRWKIVGSATRKWSLTFRIWLSANRS